MKKNTSKKHVIDPAVFCYPLESAPVSFYFKNPKLSQRPSIAEGDVSTEFHASLWLYEKADSHASGMPLKDYTRTPKGAMNQNDERCLLVCQSFLLGQKMSKPHQESLLQKPERHRCLTKKMAAPLSPMSHEPCRFRKGVNDVENTMKYHEIPAYLTLFYLGFKLWRVGKTYHKIRC